MIGIKGVRDVLVIRIYNTKGKQSTREIQVHPQLKEYLEEHHRMDKWKTRPYLFPGRHGRGYIHKGSADTILRNACKKLELEGISTHSFRRTALTRIILLKKRGLQLLLRNKRKKINQGDEFRILICESRKKQFP